MPNPRIVVPIIASFAASAILISKRNIFFKIFCNLSHHFSSQLTLVIEEFYYHELFLAVNTYLGKKSTASARRLTAIKKEIEKNIAIGIDRNEEIFDVFEDIQVRWKLTSIEDTEVRLKCYNLTFDKKHKDRVLNSYLPYIMQQAKTIEEQNKKRKIHMLLGSTWQSSIELNHPMTFDTIIMDTELKQAVMDDLKTFMDAKEYYKRIGKAKKRAYLIYGPPGTGKSSLIAAMANYLNYNIHEVYLSDFRRGEDIRNLLLHYITRSVLVIKGVDSKTEATDNLTEVEKQALLLKLLRVINGLWLPRGNELIIVIKSNDREMLDPTLLMPGLIDMQIQTSYCTVPMFEQFVNRYFRVFFRKVPEEIEELLEKVKVTPAEFAVELTRSSDYEDFRKKLCQIRSAEIGKKMRR
ncbi:hypothetical protein JCGZ_14738 [Jatropha curcas]|uniref:AAA+ ATPase domain-containing protein n=2 Tax=Jatropha curcas TaxID=180498 RepID=A0A067KJU1_JATCU|nr:hypothetical protein JCGZ_14738 [Jatropha curcas]